MQPRKRSEHKSTWKCITVLNDDYAKKYQLDDTGRLCFPFDRKTYRNIKKLMTTLECNSEENNNAKNITTVTDISKKPISESILDIFKCPDDNYDLIDPMDCFLMNELNQF